MNSHLSPTRRLFAANVKRREDRIDLGLAALLIAREEYPRLVLEDYLECLDQLGAGLAVEVDLEADPITIAMTIGAFMGGEQGFDGDSGVYCDPRSSYLNEVMDRRLGLPISLSLLYMEVARRANVQLLPVAMPGHFLLKLQAAGEEVFINPYARGELFDPEDAGLVVRETLQGRVEYSEWMLGAATKRQVLTHLLHSLKDSVRALEGHRALAAHRRVADTHRPVGSGRSTRPRPPALSAWQVR